VADRDATGGEDLVDMAQAERKSEVEPDGVADDLGREPMSGVAGGGAGQTHDRILFSNGPGFWPS
jgi:hypothetical protein